MIIQHNIMALNSYNRLSSNNTQVSKNLEKLSSGYKINRAGDDAAGLAISEKMRAQITGLTRASQNAQDGISLVQTAEGQLTEVHSMLNRMVDLATQASNGTYDNDVDRKNLQKEVSALKEEINRIAETSNFNGIKLLDGNLSTEGAGVTSNAGVVAANATKAKVEFDIDTLFGSGIAVGAKFKIGDTEVLTGDATTNDLAGTKTALGAALTGGKEVTVDGVVYKATISNNTITLEAKEAGAATPPSNANFAKLVKNGSTELTDAKVTSNTAGKAEVKAAKAAVELDYTGKTGKGLIGSKLEVGTGKYQFIKAGQTAESGYTAIEIDENTDAAGLATKVAAKVTLTGYTVTVDGEKVKVEANTAAAEDAPTVVQKDLTGGLKLQIGDTAEDSQRITVAINNMSVKGLELEDVNVSDPDLANDSIKMIKDAINSVSGTRADLGAVQNRLEHTIANLSTTTENMTAAESRIRDTDMAKEMMTFTKNNVLAQAAQAMLAQANQQPQQVLQLLR